ncbi:MAG: HAD-IIA family hydrolase [Lachnospiraceae bacterium]|nr:HAD-IIA family hydrolase [Lachnospiraceae bacterium]
MNADLNRLKRKKLFLFDIDGTLAIGDTLYDGSAQLLAHIDAIGGKAYYITNNSTRSGQDYVEKFRRAFRLETRSDQFITSGYMTLRFLKEHYPEGKIFVLGTASFREELEKSGLHITETAGEDINCVVAAYDSELNYDKLVQACKALSAPDMPFYGTNPDLCCPIDFGFIPDCGAICNMLTDATGKKPVYLGKPSPGVVELCLSLSGFSREETLVVGDRLYTDIACGINAGVDTCVVFTGEAKPEDMADTPYPADYCFADIRELLAHCT